VTPEGPDEDSPSQSGHRRRPLRVLLVDGRMPRAETLALLLMSAGCRCMSTSDVDEAIAAVRERAPDLVVIDVDLPRDAGRELAEQIRMLAGNKVRLVATSAREGEVDRLLGSETVFDSVAQRPIGLDELLGELEIARAAASG
jgi:two-component system OmpR family response regulator